MIILLHYQGHMFSLYSYDIR